MSLGELFQADLDQSLDSLASLPAPKPKPVSRWSGWSAPLRGVASAVAEVGANIADSVQGAAQVSASTGTASARGMFATQSEAEARDAELQRIKIRTEGVDTTSEVGTSLRNVARDYRPDAATAGLAEKLAFELPRFLTKAVGYTVAGGGPAGAALLAGDEAMVASDDLAREGVDRDTRMQVGAIAGVSAAAGVLLPVAAGGSIPKTIGLWAAGGPGAFMAQQAATRAVLEDADYGALGEQYDPLDPVGLAVASLVPGAFGLHAVLRARGADVGSAPRLTPDQVDAVMTHNLTVAQDVRDATSPAEAVAMMRRADPEPTPVDVPSIARELEAAPVAVEAEAPGPARELVDGLKLDPDIAARAAPLVDAVDNALKPAEPAKPKDPFMQSIDARVAEIERIAPDMVVGADETGRPVTVSQELERIRREAAEGTENDLGAQDAGLLQVAADCALSIGAA